MNSVNLIGRLTRDPDIKYIAESQKAVARFTIAINRIGEGVDYPSIVAFGQLAENCERYIRKGSRVGIIGRVTTGKYEDNEGYTHYTTDVVADRVEFLDSKN